MFEIKLTLSADDRTLVAIENLTAALTGAKPANPLSAVPPSGKASKKNDKPAEPVAPAGEAPASEPVTPQAESATASSPAPEAEVKTPTLEDVRAKVKELIDAQKLDKPKLAALLDEFGAKKVPELKPEHFRSFLSKIAA